MAYLIFAIDHDGKSETREELRNLHREHLKSVGKKLLGSGALLSDDLEEAKLFAYSDPYSMAGIRKETKVIRWRRRWVDGEFVGT